MTLSSLRYVIAPLAVTLMPALRYFERRLHTLVANDTNAVCYVLREALRSNFPDYRVRDSFLTFVRMFLAEHSGGFEADDFTECLSRYVLTGEAPQQRI